MVPMPARPAPMPAMAQARERVVVGGMASTLVGRSERTGLSVVTWVVIVSSAFCEGVELR